MNFSVLRIIGCVMGKLVVTHNFQRELAKISPNNLL